MLLKNIALYRLCGSFPVVFSLALSGPWLESNSEEAVIFPDGTLSTRSVTSLQSPSSPKNIYENLIVNERAMLIYIALKCDSK